MAAAMGIAARRISHRLHLLGRCEHGCRIACQRDGGHEHHKKRQQVSEKAIHERDYNAAANGSPTGIGIKFGRAYNIPPSYAAMRSRLAPRNRNALAITETELRLMASAAIIGDSSQPVTG